MNDNQVIAAYLRTLATEIEHSQQTRADEVVVILKRWKHCGSVHNTTRGAETVTFQWGHPTE